MLTGIDDRFTFKLNDTFGSHWNGTYPGIGNHGVAFDQQHGLGISTMETSIDIYPESTLCAKILPSEISLYLARLTAAPGSR